MYDDSDGTVLLLAVVEYRELYSSVASSQRERLQRTLSSTGPASLRAASVSAAAAASSSTCHHPKKRVAEETYAHVEIFPDEDYRFTIDCHVLVLAETQAAAEDLIFNFQVCAKAGRSGSLPRQLGGRSAPPV